MKKNIKGFSLIELIIVLAIISIISLIVQQSVSPKGLNILNATSQKLKSDIQYIRKKSMSENCYHEIIFDLIKNKYYLLKKEDGKGYVTFEEVSLPKGIAFRSSMRRNPFNENPLKYTFKGTPAKGGTIELESNIDINYKVDITISPVTGKVSIKDVEN